MLFRTGYTDRVIREERENVENHAVFGLIPGYKYPWKYTQYRCNAIQNRRGDAQISYEKIQEHHPLLGVIVENGLSFVVSFVLKNSSW